MGNVKPVTQWDFELDLPEWDFRLDEWDFELDLPEWDFELAEWDFGLDLSASLQFYHMGIGVGLIDFSDEWVKGANVDEWEPAVECA